MEELILEFLSSITDSPYLTTFLISMFPLIELKGAIPVGTALGLNLWQTAGLAYFGSTVICIPIFFLLIPVFNLLKRWKFIARIIQKIENVFKEKAAKVAEKSGDSQNTAVTKMLAWGVFIFVAIPLPLTGIWTGTAIAVFLGLRFKDAILPLALGNLTAGGIITLLTFLFKDYVEYIILGMFAFAIIMLIVFILKVAFSKTEDGGQKK